ncbi:MAG: hypothetical protein KJ077_43970 [Anaerolineae bacterium]|nr:hypothetical protein [Anaerolineae bacterium]
MTKLTKLSRGVVLVVFNVVAVVLLVALGEGLASLALFLQTLPTTLPLAERRHTQYDELLGWINIPNLYIEDMYGPGVYLQTNGQAFRNAEDFTLEVPFGKVRIICSGDSFTFGYGVNNDQAWCQRLAAKDNRLETVNMGQGGYGVDQAYLWYKRDGQKLEHDIQLFAFITTDFRRMERPDFNGYGKPLLALENETLTVTNVPVPRRSFWMPWLTQHREAINELKSVQLMRQLFFDEAAADELTKAAQGSAESVAWKILEDLARLNQARQSTLVLVYLPGQDFTDKDLTKWRKLVRTAAEQQDILFLDLVEEFKDWPPDERATMFIAKGALDYQGAAGHYTAKGNQYVADVLYERLLALPEISQKLVQQ